MVFKLEWKQTSPEIEGGSVGTGDLEASEYKVCETVAINKLTQEGPK